MAKEVNFDLNGAGNVMLSLSDSALGPEHAGTSFVEICVAIVAQERVYHWTS